MPVRNTHPDCFCWNFLVIFPEEGIWNTSIDCIEKGLIHYGHAYLGICEFCIKPYMWNCIFWYVHLETSAYAMLTV